MSSPANAFGIEAIEMAFPSRNVFPGDFGFAQKEDYYRNVSGPENIYISSPEEDAFSLSLAAARSLQEKFPDLVKNLDAIVVVTLPTEPTVAPISARIQGALGAPAETFCLDITSSCVGFLHGAALLLDLANVRGWKKALLLNVETLTKIIRPDDAPLRLLIGDAASACLFSARSRIEFEKFDFHVDGTNAASLTTRDRFLYMNGGALYERVIRTVPASFRRCLDNFGLAQESVDYFLFHQASAKVLSKLSEELNLDPAKVPLVIKEVGNIGSCSLPCLLARKVLPMPNREQKIFATAFGAGFHCGHALMRLKGTD